MFIGSYFPKLDDKGRVILPAKYRDGFEGGVVLTYGQERCIYCFPVSEFEKVAEAACQTPLSSKRARDWQRALLSSAYKELPDKQGRITIPAGLRQYAGLNKELVFAGVGTRAEIWSAESWQAYQQINDESFANTDESYPGTEGGFTPISL